MQLCSLHHCLLFFILTFTTAPVSALEICSIRGKLHQPVILSCTHRCPGLFEWNLHSKRSVVLAKCNRTSCWAEKGFSITHDQYLKGDFSLTITEADYSQRNVYACECGDSDYALVRLVIETVFTPVQMKYDEDLKLKVSVPEPVEVIYKSDDAADKVICSVTKDSLQCKDDYRHRTSLTYPELTLKHMTKGDSGSYTIRDIKNNEDIQIYAVSVEEKPGFPAWGIVLIAILPCCCIGAGIFLQYKRRMRKQLERRQQQVDLLVQEALGGTEEKIREVETSVEQLQQQYNNTVYEDKVKVFCSDKRRQLLNSRLLPVVQLVQKNKRWKKEDTDKVNMELLCLKDLFRNTKYVDKVSVFCMKQRSQVNWYRLQYSNDEPFMTTREELNRKLCDVEQLVQQAKAGTEEKITEAKKAIDELELQYSYTEYSKHVSMLCDVKRKQLDPLYSNEGLIMEREQLDSQMQDVEHLVQQAKNETEEKIREAEEGIIQLELQYFTTKYSGRVSFFCMTMRAELYWYRLLHSAK